MTGDARQRILARLNSAVPGKAGMETMVPLPPCTATREEKIEQLRRQMESMRTEVHLVTSGSWTDRLKRIAGERHWKQIICGTDDFITRALESDWKAENEALPGLVYYTQPVESFKPHLFTIDAGLTTTIGAVADSGALILWPTPAEPRLLSLVPSVHIALVHADRIYCSLGEVMQVQGWKDRMPTNALLISGPSKTADIEFTLVFGVHGPRELIVMIVE